LPSAGIALLAAIFLILLGMPAGLGMLAAGFLSVVLYRRRCPATHLTAGMGARLGALTGGLGFGVLAAILALWTAFRSGREIHDALLNFIQQYAAHSSDPRTQQVLELFNTPEGFTFIMVLTLIMILIAFLIFSSLGGAIGAFLLHRKERI
jgi:ABC-type transport system involved in multi-copper enzyme maturation permease subunit